MSAYLSAVLADAPKHYYRCADPGGGILHDIGSSPAALMLNSPVLVTPYSGPVSDGGSAWFDANVGANFLDLDTNSTPLSIECWVWQHYTRAAFQAFLDVTQPGVTALLFLATDTAGAVRVNAGTGHLSLGAPLGIQAWHHLVATRNASTVTIYVDGVSAGTFAQGAQAAVGCQINAGSNVGGTNLASANIAEMAIYASALSAARVAAHYAAADQVTSRPVYSAGGGLGGGGISTIDPLNVGILQQILQSVRRAY